MIAATNRILLLTLVAAAPAAGGAATAGQVHFPISCDPGAQAPFERAVAMLHSFRYAESLQAFTAITTAFPICAMGYWGVAMSHWHPLWAPPGTADLEAGRAAIAKAKSAEAKSEKE